jgi:hypothetical protein
LYRNCRRSDSDSSLLEQDSVADRNRVKPVFEKRLDVRAENFDAIYDDAMRVFLPSGEIDLADLAAPYEDVRSQAPTAPPVPLASVVDYSILQEVRKAIR